MGTRQEENKICRDIVSSLANMEPLTETTLGSGTIEDECKFCLATQRITDRKPFEHTEFCIWKQAHDLCFPKEPEPISLNDELLTNYGPFNPQHGHQSSRYNNHFHAIDGIWHVKVRKAGMEGMAVTVIKKDGEQVPIRLGKEINSEKGWATYEVGEWL